MKFKYWAIIFSLISLQLFSQGIQPDSLVINFVPDSLLPNYTIISTILDLRKEKTSLIGYTETKKFGIIPVDQEIHLPHSLNTSLKNSLYGCSNNCDTFSIEIRNFKIERNKRRFVSNYILKADLAFKKQSKEVGILTYNYTFSPERGKTLKSEIYENMIHGWHTQFKYDLLETSAFVKDSTNRKPHNLITQKIKRNSFLNSTVGTTVGTNFWQLEGELYFTRPETGEKQNFQASIIRYQNTKEFEMIGFGKRSEHIYKRISDNLAVDVSTNILIGINKWKHTDDIKLQQVFQISLSSNQSLNLEKKNKSGIIFKFGAFENFYYIIEKKPALQFGVYFSTGYKF